MDISKPEQRVLHLLAQGGHILIDRDETGRVSTSHVVTREGWRWNGCPVPLFQKLKRRRLIASRNGGPYRITGLGLVRVRSQLNNR